MVIMTMMTMMKMMIMMAHLASQAHHAGLYIEMGQVNRLRLVPVPGGIKKAYKGN